MRLGLLSIFVAVPLIELVVLIEVGRMIGLWPTILIVVVTGIVGTLILHRQGLLAFNRAVESMERGEIPIEPVADSVFLLLAGALLLTPGLVTDAAGLMLLVPRLRRRMAHWMLGRLIGLVRNSRQHEGPKAGQDKAGVTIEGEFERLDESSAKPRRPRSPSEPG